jgi:hypothetical protein
MSISEDLTLCLNSFRLVLEPAIEAGCSRHHRTAAKIHDSGLEDILARVRELEQQPVARADVLPFRRPRRRSAPVTSGGGDAA